MNGFSWDFYEHVRDHNHVFVDVIGMAPARFEVTRDGVEPETLDGAYAVGTLFPALGLQPAIGRLIEPQDTAAGAAPVAVVSWSYWKRRFNLDPKVIGVTIKVGGAAATIVGVTPRAFTGLQAGVMAEIWMPVTRPMGLGLLARLKPGVTIEQARAEMSGTAPAAGRRPGETDRRSAVAAIEDVPGARGRRLRGVARRGLDAPSGADGRRRTDPADRVHQYRESGAGPRRGATARNGRARIARRRSAASGAAGAYRIAPAFRGRQSFRCRAGYFGAGALMRILTARRPPSGWPQHLELQLAPDLRVLLFIAGVALVTGVLIGLAPAWSAFASAPISALRATGAAGERKSRRMFGQGLVVSQVALSLVLLSAAGLLVAHLTNLRSLNLGFRRDSVLIVSLNPRGSGLDRTQLTRFYRDLLDRLNAMPGVRSAALAAVTPIEGAAASRFASVEGYQERPEDRRRLWQNWVGPKYFETLGTPLVAGREFQFEDAGHPRVAIVNQTMARHYFGDTSPLGKHFTFEHDTVPFEIVGVAGDAKYANLHEAAPPTVYLHAFQERGVASTFALRTSVAPTAVAADVRRAVTEVLPTVNITKVTTLADQMDASLLQERVLATLSTLFGVLGASLAAMGLYGLLAYTVARRTSEIGVRMALGATQGDVTRMILKNALALVAVGLLAGAPVAAWSGRIAAGLIENLPAGRAVPVAVAALAMIGLALVAAYLPARRAARVNPVDALRHW